MQICNVTMSEFNNRFENREAVPAGFHERKMLWKISEDLKEQTCHGNLSNAAGSVPRLF